MYDTGADGYPASSRHGIPGICHQVHKHLLQLAFVRQDHDLLALQFSDEFYILPDQPGQELSYLLNGFVNVYMVRVEDLLAAEGQEAAGEGRCPFRRGQDL